MVKKIATLIIIICCFSSIAANAQKAVLDNFLVKENLLKNNKVAIIATDSAEKPVENVNGTFLFSINGFKQELKFHDGVAVAPQQIEKSTFLYIKHTNESGSHGKLYYVVKKENDLNPIKISWMVLVLVPLAIVILVSMFRKLIFLAIVVVALILFFNHSKGLNLPTVFEAIYQGIKNSF